MKSFDPFLLSRKMSTFSFPSSHRISEMSAPTASAPATNAQTQDVLPHTTTLLHAAKLAIQQDKAIQLDYYVDTASGKAFMGEDPDSKEKMLVKSNDEFTSSIQKIYKVQEDFIVVTENSIYLVNGKVQKRRVNATQMRSIESENL